jgi:hypothetical protein
MGYLLLSGLVLNLIGLILTVMSFGSISRMPQMDARGRTTYSASFLYPRLFQSGMIVLIIGFLIQILVEAENLFYPLH